MTDTDHCHDRCEDNRAFVCHLERGHKGRCEAFVDSGDPRRLRWWRAGERSEAA